MSGFSSQEADVTDPVLLCLPNCLLPPSLPQSNSWRQRGCDRERGEEKASRRVQVGSQHWDRENNFKLLCGQKLSYPLPSPALMNDQMLLQHLSFPTVSPLTPVLLKARSTMSWVEAAACPCMIKSTCHADQFPQSSCSPFSSTFFLINPSL